MRVEEYVGRRIQDRRDELGLTQEEFGRRLGVLLGKPWSRSTVSVAENGRRAFTAAELVAIASVLETNAARLLTPPLGESEVELPGGVRLDTREMVNFGAAGKLLSEVYEVLQRVQADLSVSTRKGSEALEQIHTLADRLTTEALAAGGVVSMSRVNAAGEVDQYDAGIGEWTRPKADG